MSVTYDDPAQLGQNVAAADRPLLIGLDIDGVLAPLVDHADDARLLDGIAPVLSRLVDVDGVFVAAISGRAVSSMQTFGLPAGVRLIGSHGMEEADRPFEPLDDAERVCLDRLTDLADAAASDAGSGAWVEHKNASVAVHIREADAALGARALADLTVAADGIDGASAKPGSNVLELFARHASKGTALQQLQAEGAPGTTMFVGDDLTDEEAFAVLGDTDVTIKVGDANTIAQHRLRDPEAVLAFLSALADAVATT